MASALQRWEHRSRTANAMTPKAWHHRPSHVFMPNTMYMVTTGTLRKERFFVDDERLTILRDGLFEVCEKFGWKLQAWAVFSNHYHFIAQAPEDAAALRPMLQRLHSQSARSINGLDNKPGRKVWFQYWDSCLTYEKSYFARLNYVHNNPVKHGLVPVADLYPFCSAAWFQSCAEPAFRKKVESFKFDTVKVMDDF